ncbi:MAG: thioredoxin-like domain-containing protein [Verrucomicrobia bacterium]|nr:thioredoxin-like domain-containing protein [Verrucomicrobiota bacterium]
MRLQPLLLACFLTLAAGAPPLHADWTQVTSLDLPITKLSPNPAKAKAAMKTHFEDQIAANEAYLREVKESPDAQHAHESRVRLAVAQARLASLEANSPAVNAALAQLIALEKQAPDEAQRAEAMFRRISLQWQNLGNTPDQRRENAIASANSFAQAFPEDRRSPRLLAEAASLCDNHPEQKSPLIERAMALSKDDGLTQRLQDDRKRLDQLGKPVDLAFRTSDGRSFDLSKELGHVVAVVFWSAESAPSLVWMSHFARYATEVPSLEVVSVSLDKDANNLYAAMRALKINWPVAFDGKGWHNAIARKFGINALPTLWLIDRQGCLRFLNARDNYELRINELLLHK